MIPEGWKYEDLAEVISSLQAGVSVNSEDRPKKDGEIGVLKVSAVTYGYFDANAYKTVLPSEVTRLMLSAVKDTILVSRANTKDLVGASAYVDRDYPDLFLPDKLWQLRVKEGYSIKWLGYVLAFESIRSQISNRATGTSASMKNVSQDAFLSIAVPVPTPEEQRKIAAILSTWDEAIGLVEQLIAALGRRKQALMQLLLTGAVRFAGFEGEWEEVELGEIFTLRSGKTKPEDTDASAFLERRIPIYGGNGILGYTANVLEEGERIIIGRVGEYCGVVHYIDESCWITDNALYTTSFLRETSVPFLAYLLEYLDLGKLRSKGGQPLVSQKPIYRLRTQIPHYSEQNKIAEVIQIADEVLGLINDWNEHLQEQKRGLMQQLLTGQVRV